MRRAHSSVVMVTLIRFSLWNVHPASGCKLSWWLAAWKASCNFSGVGPWLRLLLLSLVERWSAVLTGGTATKTTLWFFLRGGKVSKMTCLWDNWHSPPVLKTCLLSRTLSTILTSLSRDDDRGNNWNNQLRVGFWPKHPGFAGLMISLG